MRRRSVRAGAALAAAAILLSTPDAARAGGPEPSFPGWVRIACFSGGIDRVSAGDGLITVDSHVDCGDPLAGQAGSATFLYALYRDSAKLGQAYWSTGSAYDAVGPAPSSIVRSLPPGDFGLCVVTDITVRVGCVSISRKGATVTVAGLPTDDPLVDRAVEVVGYDHGSDPVCATCW